MLMYRCINLLLQQEKGKEKNIKIKKEEKEEGRND